MSSLRRNQFYSSSLKPAGYESELPALPDAGYTGGTGYTPQSFDWTKMGSLLQQQMTTPYPVGSSGAQQQQLQANWMSAMLPYFAAMTNAQQYANDSNEQQRQFDTTFGWQKQQDVQAMALAQAQQRLAERAAAESAGQFNQQLDYTKLFNQQQMDQAERFQLYNSLGRAMAPNTRIVNSWR